jgi:hypothetical protein
MLNPSIADEYANDPTVERCEVRAREYGYDGMVILNLFALRSTDPKVMLWHQEPVGPDNDAAILKWASIAAMVICAWGNDGAHMGRAEQVLEILRTSDIRLHCLKINTGSGQPAHPLYLSYNLKPTEWIPLNVPVITKALD